MPNKKSFSETKFAQLAAKGIDAIQAKAPDLAEAAFNIAKNPNPINAVSEIVNVFREAGAHDIAQEFEAQKQEIDRELLVYNLDAEDRASARANYINTKDFSDEIGKRVFNWNLPFVALLVAAVIVCAQYLEGGLLATIAGLVGAIIRDLMAERQTLVNFLWGSSLGSKKKDEQREQQLINNFNKIK